MSNCKSSQNQYYSLGVMSGTSLDGIDLSLGREWLHKHFIPVVVSFDSNANDLLRTIYEHISVQITRSLNNCSTNKILITGGGAYNNFLVDCIALIFAFLGVLRLRNETNCLSSVTGAITNHSAGIVHWYPAKL